MTDFNFRTLKKRLDVDPVELHETPAKHGDLLPAGGVRAIICSPSCGGKTTILSRILEDENGLRFLNVYLFSPSIDQEKYQRLYRLLKQVPGLGVHFYPSVSPIPIEPNSVVVFDDCQTGQDNLNFISQLFSHGRHRNIDVIFLVQSYAKVAKHLLRDNANFLIVLKQDEQNACRIYRDHVAGDMDYPRFLALLRHIWKKPFGFLVISKDSPINNGRYRDGFHKFVTNVAPKIQAQSQERTRSGGSSHPKKIPRPKKRTGRSSARHRTYFQTLGSTPGENRFLPTSAESTAAASLARTSNTRNK